MTRFENRRMSRQAVEQRRQRRPRRGALLLEVVVALTIAAAALALLASQLVGGLKLTADADLQARVAQLADRLLALLEVDLQTAQHFFAERVSTGDFGPQHRGFFWRAQVEPLPDTPGLGVLTIEVLHQEDPSRLDQADGARVVRSLRMLKADPARIDLERDFGITMTTPESAPGGGPDGQPTSPGPAAAQSPGGPLPPNPLEALAGLITDPTNIDPQQLVAELTRDPAALLENLPALMQLAQLLSGLTPGALPPGPMGALPAESLPGLPGPLMGAPGGAPPDPEMIRQLLQQRFGARPGQLPSGQFPGGSPPVAVPGATGQRGGLGGAPPASPGTPRRAGQPGQEDAPNRTGGRRPGRGGPP